MIGHNNSDAMIAETKNLQPEIFNEQVVKMGRVNCFDIFGYWEYFYFRIAFIYCNNPYFWVRLFIINQLTLICTCFSSNVIFCTCKAYSVACDY